MSFERMVLLANALLCVGLCYGLLTAPAFFFGNAIVWETTGQTDAFSVARLLGILFLGFALTSLMGAFESIETRAFVFKIMVFTHGAMAIGNIYNFMTGHVSGLSIIVHALFFILFLILTIRGPDSY